MKLTDPSLFAALTLSLIFFVGGIIPTVQSQEHVALLPADECDWIGSGGGGRGVRPVYLRCSRGTVLWRYPRGALRIVLSVAAAISGSAIGSRSGTAGVLLANGNGVNKTGPKSNYGSSGFRVCVKASGPTRIYLENNGTLRPVYSPRDGKNEASHRCFYTKKQRTALYVEADELTANNNRAKLQYDVEPFVVNHSTPDESDEEAECRPCSMEELAEAYCQSDLVARGTVTAVQRKPELEAAELIFRITKTLHRVEETETNEVFSILPNPHLEKSIRVRVSSACDARHGQGEFVIMARRRLGDLTLVCAPRLETWAEAVRESITAPCLLKS
ncbi:meteorin-like protein [Vespa mandarinia]|uniref:meteorin-like protein n=1 Tax=Vespa mandarinia TaxID=7446 RepID=UPI00160BF15E|nr:meteorin-like protein [Vespa mandarinia]XP_047349289.1 meteorin-like protein [Vespa velutina]